jgi:SAM-dependent methyltransferase
MEIGQLLTERESVRALDLGAGIGRNAIPFVKLFQQSQVTCDCVEILPEALEILRGNAVREGVADRIVPICSHVAEYRISPGVYDVVMAMSVLEHAYEQDALCVGIQEIQEGTRVGGFNCLSIGVDLTEIDESTGERLEPLICAHLSAHECRTMLSRLYSGWEVLRLGFSSFKDRWVREGRSIEWSANYCSFVARRVR